MGVDVNDYLEGASWEGWVEERDSEEKEMQTGQRKDDRLYLF